MKEDKKILVLYDTEEEYADLFSEYLKKQKELPWETYVYTRQEDFIGAEGRKPDLLLVAESAYTEELNNQVTLCIIILNESGTVRWKDLRQVNKYQPAEEVLRFLLQVYMEVAETALPRLRNNTRAILLGIYSPLSDHFQSEFALNMASVLAENHSVIYLDFEYCAGFGELLTDFQVQDIADLLFFINSDKEKFRLKIQTIRRSLGKLHYIPPVRSGQDLLVINTTEWLSLIQHIEELEEYEYIVMNLSNCMHGLHQVMRACSRIVTPVKDLNISEGKLLQYEKILEMSEFEDVLQKSIRVEVPHITKRRNMEDKMTKGEIIAFIRKFVEGELKWNIQN